MSDLNSNSVLLDIPKPNYEYITSDEDARKAMNYIDKYDVINIDTEATDLNPYKAKLSLVQMGVIGKAFVFDVRHDTDNSSLNIETLFPLLKDKTKLKVLQNAVFDMNLFKLKHGFYLENIYDTMLVEQLLTLGLHSKTSLDYLVAKYLGLKMEKQTRGTFTDYYQKFKTYQLEYSANDVLVLPEIRNLQLPLIEKHGLEDACRLEFEFTKSLCEMELNGIMLDVDKWRLIMEEVESERVLVEEKINRRLAPLDNQTTLFGISLIDTSSPAQLKKALNKLGFPLLSTDVKELQKFKGTELIDNILSYRKLSKLITTYGESLLERINGITNRLHTEFRQMVATGRMSSSRPNLQNIPKKQKFRSCFVASPGYKLITSDMSGAELRILGNLSEDPMFIDAYSRGIDLHSKTASDMFDLPLEDIKTKYNDYRGIAKTLNFGLIYGLSKFGLSVRLGVSEKEAEDIINKYFKKYRGIKKYLDRAAKEGVYKRHSRTISGRKRFYTLPPYTDPNFKRIKAGIERQAKNAAIQGCVCAGSVVKGKGYIEDQVEKVLNIDTGFGFDTAIGVSSGKKHVYELKFSNGVKLGITKDHKIPVVRDNGDFVDVSVSDLSNKDYIIVPLNVVSGEATNLCGYKYKKGHRRETFIEYKYPEKMNEKLSFIIGCLIGYGSYTKYNHFKFVCPENQIELFDKFNSCVFDVFGYKPIIKKLIREDRNSVLYISQISSVAIRGFLKHIGLDYVKHRGKKIPKYFYKETILNRGSLLNGLFSTDGGMTKKSGPNFTSSSEDVAISVHQLLFSVGINSNLKECEEDGRKVFRLQVPKRFNNEFKKYVGFSVEKKRCDLIGAGNLLKFGDDSKVPSFIPETIEKVLRRDDMYLKKFSYNEKAHLRRFKLGKCSYTSWRKFYKKLPNCNEKEVLRKYLNVDFCKIKNKKRFGIKDTYDLVCDSIHYFVVNGVIVHNSNADTIKQSMIYCVDRLKEGGYDARLLLTVHDEIVVEAKEDQAYEVKELVDKSLIDGFGHYFNLIPMEAEGIIGPCWLKDGCKGCGGIEMVHTKDEKYGTKVVCKKCGKENI